MNTEGVCGAISVNPDSEILMITNAGQTVRCEVRIFEKQAVVQRA